MSYDLALIDGDIWFDELGHLILTEDKAKLAQQASKIIFEYQGDNLEDFGYGTNLRDQIGSVDDLRVIENTSKRIIEDALNLYIQYQQTQIGQGQYLSADEILDSYANITITRLDYEPRQINISVDLFSASGDSQTIEIPIIGGQS